MMMSNFTLSRKLVAFFITTAFITIMTTRVEAIFFPSFQFVSVGKTVQNFWDGLNIKRTMNNSCECGRVDVKNWKTPWNLYVHVVSTATGHMKTCSGTIVASNLVVTSHKCLVLSKKKMRFYDLLKIRMQKEKDRSMAALEEVLVTNTKVFRVDTIHFKVIDIFYNPQYALNSELETYTENDLVIIKVADNFFSHSENFSPICVPFFEAETTVNMSAFYYSHTTERRNFNLRLAEESDLPHVHLGTILETRLCYEHLYVPETTEMDHVKTLCFEFAAEEKHSNVEGGPVMYVQHRNNSPSPTYPPFNAFLMGVSTDISSGILSSGYGASAGFENVYFSPIKPLVKFIEYYANFAKKIDNTSVWCQTPQLEPHKITPMRPIRNGFPQDISEWPWDNIKDFERDDSLDCICGVALSRQVLRITGGVEVRPMREYGWIAELIIYHNGKGQPANICGGSIINDRIILTAAHCVVDEEKIANGIWNASVAPENVVVTINAHFKSQDDKGIKVAVSSVLFHPQYIHAKSGPLGNFDADIAMLILKDKLTFPFGVTPICLPEPGKYMPVVGKNATVIGWGLLDPMDDYSLSDTLQQVSVPIVELSVCEDLIRYKVTENFLCAGTLNRYKDASRGDSGGPLMIQDHDTKQWTAVGVVSFGDDVGELTAAFYSDVQRLLPFVDYHSRRVKAKWCRYK